MGYDTLLVKYPFDDFLTMAASSPFHPKRIKNPFEAQYPPSHL
jgi:hypothetical protein